MPQITLAPVDNLAALGARWRALEQSAEGGFFKSWSFLGCQAETRFTAPFLLSVTDAGVDLVLGLLNRRRGRFYVGETGNAAQDAVFAEHGGLLVRTGAEAILPAAFAGILAQGTLRVGGIDSGQLGACAEAGLVHVQARRFAPALNLSALDRPYLETLSANTRGQIRRATRLYGGTPTLVAAASLDEALIFFDAMVRLHTASWQIRSQTGAFADATLLNFHHSLIGRAWPRGEADMLRLTGDSGDIGYLYNFRHGGRVFCYQSGFVPPATPQEKPGMVCHSLAIAHYAAQGERIYDMLGGASRYKTSLVPGGETLHWATVYAKTSLLGRVRLALVREPGIGG